MLPVQITIRDIPISPAVETHIRKKAQKLNQYYDRISSCRIVVELETKNKHQGKLYNVRIDLTVPGKELVTTRKNDEDLYIAIRNAFDAMGRQLEDHSRKRHGRVKTHNNVMHGTIVRILPTEGYGFIEGMDGNEYYFGMTNVSYPQFNQLVIGDAVQYISEPLSEGRQAQHICRERHNHLEE
jgi:ribosomal subunit interface protein